MGFEPTTSTLARLHSTTELFSRIRRVKRVLIFAAFILIRQALSSILDKFWEIHLSAMLAPKNAFSACLNSRVWICLLPYLPILTG